VGIGPLQLGELAKGSFRVLKKEEKRMLDHAIGDHAVRARIS
jgi:hypothetical protein